MVPYGMYNPELGHKGLPDNSPEALKGASQASQTVATT